jgi:hypothetical protein
MNYGGRRNTTSAPCPAQDRTFVRARTIGSFSLRTLHGIGLDLLPRMADFALWAAACETALRPAGTFGPAYEAKRRSAIQGIVDADPVAACARESMAKRSSWMGSAGDLLRTVGLAATTALRTTLPAGSKIPCTRWLPASRFSYAYAPS